MRADGGSAVSSTVSSTSSAPTILTHSTSSTSTQHDAAGSGGVSESAHDKTPALTRQHSGTAGHTHVHTGHAEKCANEGAPSMSEMVANRVRYSYSAPGAIASPPTAHGVWHNRAQSGPGSLGLGSISVRYDPHSHPQPPHTHAATFSDFRPASLVIGGSSVQSQPMQRSSGQPAAGKEDTCASVAATPMADTHAHARAQTELVAPSSTCASAAVSPLAGNSAAVSTHGFNLMLAGSSTTTSCASTPVAATPDPGISCASTPSHILPQNSACPSPHACANADSFISHPPDYDRPNAVDIAAMRRLFMVPDLVEDCEERNTTERERLIGGHGVMHGASASAETGAHAHVVAASDACIKEAEDTSVAHMV